MTKIKNEKTKFKYQLFALTVLVLIFLLNDFVFLKISHSYVWVLVDYSLRIISIIIFLILFKLRLSSPRSLGLSKVKFKQITSWTAILLVYCFIANSLQGELFQYLLPGTKLVSYPQINNFVIKIIDLSFGLFLVALTEEAIFRGFFYQVFRKFNYLFIILLSSFLFGLAHWSLGVGTIITSFIWAILPMISIYKTRNIIPVITAHYFSNFIFVLPIYFPNIIA